MDNDNPFGEEPSQNVSHDSEKHPQRASERERERERVQKPNNLRSGSTFTHPVLVFHVLVFSLLCFTQVSDLSEFLPTSFFGLFVCSRFPWNQLIWTHSRKKWRTREWYVLFFYLQARQLLNEVSLPPVSPHSSQHRNRNKNN